MKAVLNGGAALFHHGRRVVEAADNEIGRDLRHTFGDGELGREMDLRLQEDSDPSIEKLE